MGQGDLGGPYHGGVVRTARGLTIVRHIARRLRARIKSRFQLEGGAGASRFIAGWPFLQLMDRRPVGRVGARTPSSEALEILSKSQLDHHIRYHIRHVVADVALDVERGGSRGGFRAAVLAAIRHQHVNF
jgi:hypothetical protein